MAFKTTHLSSEPQRLTDMGGMVMVMVIVVGSEMDRKGVWLALELGQQTRHVLLVLLLKFLSLYF